MKIAVLSGKGGAGKTLVSVNLASIMDNSTYIDCDVEEPNGRLFFKPSIVEKKDVNVYLPKQDIVKCNGCKKCVEFCRFNAIAMVNKKLLVFDEVCHSCYGCKLVCPQEAISMTAKRIGVIEKGKHNNVEVVSGILNIGEGSGVSIIKELLNYGKNNNVIIDCPPGSSCSVMESIKDADYCVLVAEPTRFGVHNLNMVYELIRKFNKKCGVILNKNIEGNNLAKSYCEDNNITVVGKINWDDKLANISTNGRIATEDCYYKDLFKEILNNILEEVAL